MNAWRDCKTVGSEWYLQLKEIGRQDNLKIQVDWAYRAETSSLLYFYWAAEQLVLADIKRKHPHKQNPNFGVLALIMSLLQNLPHDIIIDILSRLPAKTLLKFRCVSKQWNSLIRSHKFTELHSNASNKDLISRQRVLLCALPFNFNFVKYDVVEKYGVLVTEDTPFPLAVADVANVVVVGEYNGMICIMIRCDRFGRNGEKIFYLWNPSSRECREVRRADVANVVDTTRNMFDALDVGRGGQPYNAYGFGYDSTSDDYKIVKFSRNFVEVYMVGGRTWRKIELPSHGMFRSFWDAVMGSTCPFVNGNCHWIMKKAVGGVREIVSFDLAKEKLEEVIQLPELSKGKRVRDLNAFGGKLAVIVETPRLEIWVMDIYGVGSSWTKKVTLQEVARGSVVRPICFSRNGGVLVCVDDSTLMMYDPEKETYSREKELRLRRKYSVVYVESLVSPNHVPNADRYLGL